MRAASAVAWMAAAAIGFAASGAVGAELAAHLEVRGPSATVVTAARLRRAGGPWRTIAWDDLAATALAPGRYEVRVHFATERDGESVQIPACAGRSAVRLDSRSFAAPPGPLVVPADRGEHELSIELDVSSYERRVACGEAPRTGTAQLTTEGLGVLSFDSPHASPRADDPAGKAVVFVPPGHDVRSPLAVLVGLHPWNGSAWTYAAYEELIDEARARDVLLLMPSGLGNSLYTADAEDEVLRAVDALSIVATSVANADHRPRIKVSIWGASMGGAGATTIAFHHPDRFVSVTSFFGDSRYDLSTYVHSILHDVHEAHLVNAIDVVDNARNLPVWLIHGEDDATSPVRQSAILAAGLEERGFAVRFDRVAGAGHAGALVARFLPQVVAAAAERAPPSPTRVTYRSVTPSLTGAYGVRLERASPLGDAFVDVERRDDGVHVRRVEAVRTVWIKTGSLGTSVVRPPPLIVDDASSDVAARWSAMEPPSASPIATDSNVGSPGGRPP